MHAALIFWVYTLTIIIFMPEVCACNNYETSTEARVQTHCIVIDVVTRAFALRLRVPDRPCLSDSSWKRPLTHMGMIPSLLLPLPSRVKVLPGRCVMFAVTCGMHREQNARASRTAVAIAKREERDVDAVYDLWQRH